MASIEASTTWTARYDTRRPACSHGGCSGSGDGIDNLPGARQAFAHIWRWAACPRWPCAAPNSAWAALRRGAVLAASLTLLYYPRHAVGQVCQVAEEEEALQAEGGHDLPVRRRREDPARPRRS